MALPDHLADLERKLSARLNEGLAGLRREMRRAVETEAQRARSAMLSELDQIAPLAIEGLFADDLLRVSHEERRTLARSLRLALVDFDRARTQSAVLEALLAGARPFGDRAALWLMRPQEILGWASLGFSGEPVAGVAIAHATSPALQRLAEGRGCVLLAGADAAQLASVLEIEAPKQALLVPLVLRDRVAAALYLDSAAAAELEIEALQMLTLAAAQRLELQALTTRSYTPTLFLEGEAPASERGLALWDPDVRATEAPLPEGGERIDGGTPAAAEEEHDTIVEAMPTVASGFDLPAPEHPAEPARAAIAWQMAETAESVFPEAVQLQDLMAAPVPSAPLAEIPEMPSVGAALIDFVPFSPPPAVEFTAPEERAVEETTAPHSTLADASTQRFAPPPADTSEISPPPDAELPPVDFLPAASSAAATLDFEPPVAAPEPDLADEATVRIDRNLLPTPSLPPPAPPAQPPPPAPLPAAASAPEPPEEQTHPSLSRPSLPEEEPTIVRTARTTEVIAPPDLQGPGWAFTSTRSPRGSGDNALHEEARRLARLLVSEIKLYNEDQVEEGRHNRDLYHRLKDDIDRSRQIYEERVHESVRGTTDYFQQELIRSLAGGDPRALGI